ncbi:MAG TPA: DoxX family protein [Bryobacteraceae bacterium]|nr:DoxX family protein [Bryobacteraceae bacterium]
MYRLLATENSVLPLILRLTLGIIMFAHGAQKVLGWFGGSGYEATYNMFTQGLGLPPVLAVLAIYTEFLGGLGLIIGLFARIAATGIFGLMVGAVLLVHLPNGLFMNWAGNQQGEGYEYHLLAMAVSLAIIWMGAGALSIDHALTRYLARRRHLPYPTARPGELAGQH